MNVIGDNVQWEITERGVLAIYIDLSAETHESNSGKTLIIASTGGNKKLQPENGAPVYLGLNCYKYPEKD